MLGPQESNSASFTFTLNDALETVAAVDPSTTLLEYLRRRGLTGTKEGCNEGDCGACTVVLVDRDVKGRRAYRAVNSCIMPLPSVAGREIYTVEGLARGGALHPVQQALVTHQGSQCGFCTPGFVMSMFEGYYRPEVREPWQIADQLAGNLCRCTGYRPIRDAMAHAIEQRPADAHDRFAQALERPTATLPAIDYRHGGARFVRPTSLHALFEIIAATPSVQLVAGATELGVYHNKLGRDFPLLVSTDAIPELRRIETTPEAYLVGGAATLTDLEQALGDDLPLLHKMLAVFASRQIRNRATLAGNLATASPIGDMAPVLLALDAELVLASQSRERRVAIADFFVSYRQTALAAGEIICQIIIPRTTVARDHRRLVDSFKVSKRRELDISIVAAAFVLDTDAQNIVRRARLAYGGVAPMPMRALGVEAFLLGKPLDEATMRAVRPVLLDAFAPISDLRASAEFRRALIATLFEKLVRGSRSAAQDARPDFSKSERFGKTSLVTGPGRDLAHESTVGHVTGRAQYVDDTAKVRPMLEVWPVYAPCAHGRVRTLDVTVARAMPGIAAVLTAADVAGTNDVGAIRHDEPLFATDEILFHGQTVALVVGESYDACRRAAKAVVLEVDELPAILSIEEAERQGSFHSAPHRISRGEIDTALAGAKHRLSGTLTLGGQDHFYLETHAAFADPGDDGDMHVVASTQHPSETQAVVARVLGLRRHQVVVQSPRMGGGFGGKETQANTYAAMVALAAHITGKPVRLMLDRDLDMTLSGKRHPFLARYEVGFDSEGHLEALRAELISNGGWALDLSEAILDRALFHVDNAYYVPHLEVTGRVAKTHMVSFTAFRGFGGPQGMLVIEEALDRIARTLGIDPAVVRERNLYGDEGEQATTHYGQLIEDNRIGPMWRALADEAELKARRKAVTAFNAKSDDIKRGLAVTPVKFGISFTATFLNQAGALVNIYADGTVQVNHGGTEMGQGLYTKILGIAMRELGLPAERIRVMKTQTDKVPNTSATAASSGADLNGAAVRNACVSLRERLAPIAASLIAERHGLGITPERLRFADGAVGPVDDASKAVSFEDVTAAAYVRQVSLSSAGFYRTPGIGYDRVAGKGRPFYYFAFGVAATEVEVDGLSGMKRIRRVDILHDVGDSLNPAIDRGQIEGGFLQGVGWLTGEELSWDAQGHLLTHSASTYQVPAFSDAPAELHVRLLDGAENANVVHGSKAVGEPPFMLAISVREALRDAIAAFGSVEGPLDLPVPATHEAIFHAVQARRGPSAKPTPTEGER